jgi:hypothetical protein
MIRTNVLLGVQNRTIVRFGQGVGEVSLHAREAGPGLLFRYRQAIEPN